MRSVFLKFSLGYALLHLYFLRTIHLAFPYHWRLIAGAAALGILMVAAPIIIHRLGNLGFYRTARAMALIGTPWQAILLWFCTLAFAMDLWNFALKGVTAWAPWAQALHLPPRPALAFFAVLIVAAVAWSLWEAANVRLEAHTLRSARVTRPIRVLHISDLHLGVGARPRVLNQVLDLIHQTAPDVVVSTGDLVDGPYEHIRPLADRLARIRPKYGKFAILGNHEFYAGLDESLPFLEAAGFSVIRGESVAVCEELRLVGVDDPVGRSLGHDCRHDEDNALPTHEDREMTVLLKHRPTIMESSLGRFDLQLSGHTHGGQISTDRLLLLRYPLRMGFNRFDDDTAAYISRGSGTWGPPMRLFSPPEVALITIIPAEGSGREAD